MTISDNSSLDPTESAEGNSKSATQVGDTFEYSTGATRQVLHEVAIHSLKDYRVLGLIGRGGMGAVYEAVETTLNRRVALKILPPESGLDPQRIARFKNEAKAVAQLNHPHIVPVYRVGNEKDIHYYSMQLIEGRNLAAVIKSISHELSGLRSGARDTKREAKSDTQVSEHQKAQSGSSADSKPTASGRMLNADEFLAAMSTRRRGSANNLYRAIALLIADVADALAHAHANGVIHRDVKPSNILVDDNGKAWITDFGLALIQDATVATNTGDVVGTFRYMSPEQASGRKFLIDHRTDIYSLGATLYELLCLHQPFDGKSPRELLRQVSFEEPKKLRVLNPTVPTELEVIVTKATAKNPLERYETAADFAEDLRRFATDRPIIARPPNLIQRSRRFLARHKVVTAAAGIVTGVIFFSSVTVAAVYYDTANKTMVALKETSARARENESYRLVVKSMSQLPTNPGLALVLSKEACKLNPTTEARQSLINAMKANHELFRVEIPPLGARSIDTSLDGTRLVVTPTAPNDADRTTPALILDSSNGKLIQELQDSENITRAVFHPVRRLVLTSTVINNNTIPKSGVDKAKLRPAVLWDLDQNGSKRELEQSRVFELTKEMFSPDGNLLALPSLDNTVSIYELPSCKRVAVGTGGHAAMPIATAISRDGKLLASLDEQGQVIIWELPSMMERKRIQAGQPTNSAFQLGFTSDSSAVVISFADRTSIASCEPGVERTSSSWTEPSFAINPRRNRLANYWPVTSTVTVRDASDGKILAKHSMPGNVNCVSYSPDGETLIISAGNSVFAQHELDSKRLFELRGHSTTVFDHAVSFANQRIFTIGDQSLRIWSTVTQLAKDNINRSTWGSVPTVDNTLSTDERFYALGNSQTVTALLNTDAMTVSEIGKGKSSDAEFSRDRTVLVDEDQVSIVHAPSRRQLASIKLEEGRVRRAELIPNSEDVLVWTDEGLLLRWDTKTNRLIGLNGSDRSIFSWDISPDGNRLAVGVLDGCRIVKIADGSIIKNIPHHGEVIETVWTGNDETLITIDRRGAVLVWKSLDAEMPTELSVEGTLFESVKVKSDRILARPRNRTGRVHCWNRTDSKLIGSVESDSLTQVDIHPKQDFAILHSIKSGLTLWNLSTGETTKIVESGCADAVFIEDEIVFLQLGSAARALHETQVIDVRDTKNVIAKCSLSERKKIVTHSLPMSGAALSVDEKAKLALVSGYVWPVICVKKQGEMNTLEFSQSSPALVIRRMPGTEQVLTYRIDGNVAWLSEAGTLKRMFEGSGLPLVSGDISKDGKTVVAGDTGGNILVWNTESGELTKKEAIHAGAVKKVWIDHSVPSFVYSFGEDDRLRGIDLASNTQQTFHNENGIVAVYPLKDQMLVIQGFSFVWRSEDLSDPSKRQATKSKLGRASLVKKSDFSAVPINVLDNVALAAVSKDGARIALVSSSGELVVVNSSDLSEIGRTMLTLERPQAIAFDGQEIAVLDGQHVELLNAETGFSIWSFDAEPRATAHRSVHYWNPVAAFDGEIVFLGSGISRIPIEPHKVADRFSSRTLTAAERKLFAVDREDSVR
ncbi:MAG: protein kinase [Pirellulales bacterium]